MIIPVEIIVVFLVAIVGIQSWILLEVITLKVRLSSYEDLKSRVEKLEKDCR